MAEPGGKGGNPTVVNIHRAKNVFLGSGNNFAASGHQHGPFDMEGHGGIQDLCPESLVVALLKDILYHCPGRKEAMFTLEDNLCTKLRDVGRKRIVSFQEHFKITFREFLENHSEDFDLTFHNHVFTVSRVVGRPKKCSGSFKEKTWPSNPRNRPEREREATDQHQGQCGRNPTLQGEPPGRTMPTLQPTQQTETQDASPKKETRNSESEKNIHQERESVSSAVAVFDGPQRQPEVREQIPKQAATVAESHVGFQTCGGFPKWSMPAANQNSIESFVDHCLKTHCGDTLEFKVSDEEYGQNPIQFTIDVISLWNTPDRESAYIILGVKPLVCLPHQVIGLKDSKKHEFYHKLFLWNMFDFPPKFKYTETLFKGKRVGIVEVKKSAGVCHPCIVKSDDKKPHLTKNQLWFREENKNIVANGSDMNNEHVTRIFSWFMESSTVQRDTETLNSSKSLELTINTDTRCVKSPSRIAPSPDLGSGHESHGEVFQPSVDPTSETGTSASSHPEKATGDSNPERVSCETKPVSDVMKALNHFRTGHFILLCGTLPRTVPNLDALSCVPWIAVYDFDVCGRDTGLLAYLEHGLRQRRSTSVFTWMDPHTAITERGTQWWSLRGRLEVPDSNLSELSPKKWLQKVCVKLENLSGELARLSQDYTILSIIVLWPTSKEEMKGMEKFLNELQKRIHVQPSIFLLFTESTANHADTHEVQNIIEDSENNVRKLKINLEEFCKEVSFTFTSVDSGLVKYQLPGEGAPLDIPVEMAAYLTQDFEVLYLQNLFAHREMTAEDLQSEGNNFFRGGSLSWSARYDMGANCFDIERCNFKVITKHIKQHIEEFRPGVIQLLHAPGSGGSTLAQRILFDLHETTPCIHIKQHTGSAVEDVVERLRFLTEHTHMPVVALLDGEDEQKIQLIKNQLPHISVIFIHVRRYPYYIDRQRACMEHRNLFFVPGFVTKKESRNLVVQFQTHCCDNEGKKRALRSLDEDIQKNRQDHQMFEYGLTVFNHEFRGVQAYVKGYLQTDNHRGRIEELQPWQRCLGYMALVYYYAQASLPCFFVGSLMGDSAAPAFEISDLPFAAQMLVVPDVNEGKRGYIRIMHYTVAQEILEQILNTGLHRSSSGNLSNSAKQNLKDFCLRFLDHVVSDGNPASSTLQSVLTKTFILRDFTDLDDAETEGKKKPQFSAILLDLDSKAPYSGRLQIFKKLCDICPEDASLRAHLGRFYSLCRPDEPEEAEHHFIDAVKIAGVTENQGQLTESQKQSDVAYIYHMYGCFLKRKVSRKLSLFSGSTHFRDVIEDAERSCQKFTACRFYAPTAVRDAHQYFTEIDIRLQVCQFVGQVFPGGLQGLLKPQQQTDNDVEFRFVKDSIIAIQDLIMECSNAVLLDEASLASLQRRVRHFNAIFRGVAEELQALAEDDPIASLRLKVTAKKLQYANENGIRFAENPNMPGEVMQLVVAMLEQIFSEGIRYPVHKDKLEMDYQDWILSIRNPNFPKDYPVTEVLDHVRCWRKSVEGIQSMGVFYQFVLLSLLGFGTSTSAGHEKCLEDAVMLKTHMKKQSKADPKARLPREWLGSDSFSGIRRLVSHGCVPMDHRRVKAAARDKLANCKGTVKGKPKKACGFITMDPLCPKTTGSKRAAEVFFVPARAETATPLLHGTRVQFYLAFTQENGYEAYEVAPLERSQCPSCGLWVEITRDKISVSCQGKTSQEKTCNTLVSRKNQG